MDSPSPGAMNGYIRYLDSSRTDYWDGYAKYVWDKSSDLQEQFHHSYDNYYDQFYAALDQRYQKAKVLADNTLVPPKELKEKLVQACMASNIQTTKNSTANQFKFFSQNNDNISKKATPLYRKVKNTDEIIKEFVEISRNNSMCRLM